MARVKISAPEKVFGTVVEIDGQVIPGVFALRLDLGVRPGAPGGPPRGEVYADLWIGVRGDLEIEGEAVEVAQAVETGTGVRVEDVTTVEDRGRVYVKPKPKAR